MHGVALAWATTAVALVTCFALCHHRQRRAYVLDWGPGMHNIQQLLLSLTTECAVLSCGQVFKYSVHGRFGYLTTFSPLHHLSAAAGRSLCCQQHTPPRAQQPTHRSSHSHAASEVQLDK